MGRSRPAPRSAGEGTFPSSARSWRLPSPVQPNAWTPSWLSDRVPSSRRPGGLAPLPARLVLLFSGERRYLPHLSVPSRLTNAVSTCLTLQSAQDSKDPLWGILHAEQGLAENSVLELLFSSDLCWHAQAAGGTRRMTRVQEQRRGSQPFHQIERELMRGWRAFSIPEGSREQGDRAWLQPEKDPKSKSSFCFFLLVFFGNSKKE